MSVMVLSLNHFKEVYNKACKYQYSSVVDINYCGVLSNDNQNSLKLWCKSLLELNYKSYCKRYEEECDLSQLDAYNENIDLWDWDKMGKACSTYQMLKYLECIHYNIELDKTELDSSAAYKKLVKAINEIKYRIINNIPEYANAKWCI